MTEKERLEELQKLNALYEMMIENQHKIETIDKEGNKKIMRQLSLPKKMKPEREVWEELGFVFNDIPGDDIMYRATLPNGWNIRGTETPLWNEIIDENEMVRGSLFYTPASYDRNAFMYLDEKQKEEKAEHTKNR